MKYEERPDNIVRENVERLMMKANNDPFTFTDIKFDELLRLNKGMV